MATPTITVAEGGDELGGMPHRWLPLTQSADQSAPVNLVRLRAGGALTHRCGTLVPLPPSRLNPAS